MTARNRPQDSHWLRNELDKFRLIFEKAGQGIAIIQEGYITMANPWFYRFAEYTEEELRGRHILDFVHPEDREMVGAYHVGRCTGKEVPDRYEFRGITKSGGMVWVEISGVLVEWEGKPASLNYFTDITKRKRAEADLKNTLAATNDGIWDYNLVTDTFEYSERWATMLGYAPGEVAHTGCFCRESTHPEDRKHFEKTLTDYLEGRSPIYGIEFRLKTKQGGYKWIYSRGRAVEWDEHGNPVRIIGAHTDIDGRKEDMEALRESEEQMEIILNASTEMIVYFDKEMRVVWANRVAAECTGLAESELVGRTCYDIWRKRTSPCPGCEACGVLQEGAIRFFERASDDGRIWWVRLFPVTDAQNSINGFVRFATDISRRKQAEAEKERLETQLQQSQKLESIGRLAGGVAHDLNNLLSPILGYGEMMLHDAVQGDPRRDSLEQIIKAGNRARDLVRQLLAFSRKQTLEFKTLDLNRLIQGFEKLLRRTIRENIVIKTVLSGSLPRVMGDVGQLEQVIMNMAVNAQDAMDGGGILTIGTESQWFDDQDMGDNNVLSGEYAVLVVRDTGVGMEEQTREHIFEPFYTTKARDKGTGLGLATVYGIVKQHGGHMEVETRPGSGTTFTVYLPAAHGEEAAGDESHVSVPSANGSETILFAEDNRQVRELTTTILKREGYVVLSAESGERAMECMQEHQGNVDLLLTDVIMPGMNGRELADRVMEISPGTRVLFMSGYIDDTIAEHGVIKDGVMFLHKPFSVKVLLAKVRETLEK
ncbi:hybrid sensor histidine kinase/response regulator [Desulfoplanes sp.]